MVRNTRNSRRGATLVLVVMCLIPLVAFVALSIDLGLLAAARTQITDAADAAAMAGARALNGNTASGANNNYAAVLPTAQQALTANKVLNTALSNSQLTVNIGRYTYNTSTQQFEGLFPGPSTENWSLVQATVSCNVNDSMSFSKLFNFTVPNLQATASAAHRPRDVAIILDFSGSMRFASLAATPYSGGSRTTNNPDTVYPTYGQYSVAGGSLRSSGSSAPYDDANITTTTSDGRGPIVNDFYTSATGGQAFTAAPSSYDATPAGDKWLKTNKNAGSSWAQTLAQILNISSPTNSTIDTTFENNGYNAWGMSGGQFNRYTTGPGYYGKTFFIWPPDPSDGSDGVSNDWRERYFDYPGTTTGMDDNSRLWDTSGNWLAPSSTTYQIDYAAILNFIKNIGPNPFPSRLQAGRILYYDAIPDTINTSSWPPSDLNQRFWKDYIDYVLGVIQEGSSYTTLGGYAGYGADYTWGTIKITAKSSLAGVKKKADKPYMHYGDNPKRPLLRFWFGPLTMVDFLGNYNMWYHANVNPDCSRFCWWPGTCREAPMYACKLGIRAALTDINNNHPNDLVSLIYFSVPKSSSSDTSATRFNRVRVPLGRDYDKMQEALWYPPATIGNANATVRPYDANNLEVPRAMGGTCYSYPLMLAYNQFSSNASLKTYNASGLTGDAGGNGRRGAQKLVIFETDGAPNTLASAGLTNNGSGNSYYNIRINGTGGEFPTGISGTTDNSSTIRAQIYGLCTQLAAADTASPPGYSSGAKKLKIHCIGFGPVFDSSSASAAACIETLNQMQIIGNVNDGMPSYKIINGTESQVITKLQQAFTKIMQDFVQVTLIQ